MKIAVSVLDCKDRVKGVLELNRTNVEFIHIDVMDGKFVPSIQFDNMDEIRGINKVSKYPMDVHLMVDDPSSYIKELGNMNIEFITIHLEIGRDKKEIFKEIRELGYKVGLSIKPNTKISELRPYLDYIDMVLVMSVEPGLGGQSFMEETVDKIRELRELIGNRNILIEVDGGINNKTITKLEGVDIAVVGSYITKSDNYYERIEELLKPKGVLEKENNGLSDDGLNKNKRLYKVLLGIGIIPFALLFVTSIFNAIFGFSGLCIGMCDLYFGFSAFIDTIVLFSFVFWPIEIISLILIIVSIVKLKKLKKKS